MTAPRDIAIAIKDDPLPSRSGVAFANFVSNFSGTASANPPTAAQVVQASRTDPDRQRAGEMLADFIAANGATNGVSGMIATEVVRAVRDDPQPERSGALLLSFVQTFGPAGEEGGGGDTPAWLPAGALAFADFSAGHYYAGGAETTLSAISLDAVALVIGGTGLVKTGSDNAPAIIGDFLAALLAGEFTAQIDFDTEELPDTTRYLLGVSNADDTTEFNISAYPEAGFLFWAQDYDADTNREADTASVSAGAVKVAATRTATKLAVSVNGAAAVLDNTALAGAVFTQAFIGGYIPANSGNGSAFTLRSITIYPPKPDADLPALSALA